MSKDERIHLRVDRNLKKRVTEIAQSRNLTVTKLAEMFFIELVRKEDETRPKTDEELGVEQA